MSVGEIMTGESRSARNWREIKGKEWQSKTILAHENSFFLSNYLPISSHCWSRAHNFSVTGRLAAISSASTRFPARATPGESLLQKATKVKVRKKKLRSKERRKAGSAKKGEMLLENDFLLTYRHHSCTHTQIYMHKKQTSKYICIHIGMHKNIKTYKHTYKHIRIYIYIYTEKNKRNSTI